MSRVSNELESATDSPRRWRRLGIGVAVLALAWSFPRPGWQEEVVLDADAAQGRLAFRTARRLTELVPKGPRSDETEFSEPCFARDGLTLYFTRTRRGQRSDIVRSHLEGERWSRPEVVRELNSVDDDRGASIADSGRLMAFASNRSGGQGGWDLFESASSDDRWQRPKNMGTTINSAGDESEPAYSLDGLTLYFTRRHSGDSADIFVSHRETLTGDWSAPEPVTSINMPDTEEISACVSADGRWLYFASNRTAPGVISADAFDLFRARIRDGAVETPEQLSDGICSPADDVDPSIAPDGRTLLFASRRENTLQLFAARGDYVVARLNWNATHLTRFGAAAILLPLIAAVLLVKLLRGAAWKPNRQLPNDKPVAARKPRTETANLSSRSTQPPQRSEPTKNPLAGWLPPPNSDPTKLAPTTQSLRQPRRFGRNALIAASLIAAIALFVQQPRWLKSIGRSLAFWIDPFATDWHEFARLTEFSAPRAARLPEFAHTNTARTVAPEPNDRRLGSLDLRKAARWPAERVVVRQPRPVPHPTHREPELPNVTQRLSLAMRAANVASIRPAAQPDVEFALTATPNIQESASGTAAVGSNRQFLTPMLTADATSASIAGSHHSLPLSIRLRADFEAATGLNSPPGDSRSPSSLPTTLNRPVNLVRNGGAVGLPAGDGDLQLPTVIVNESATLSADGIVARTDVTGPLPICRALNVTKDMNSDVLAAPRVRPSATAPSAAAQNSSDPIAAKSAEPAKSAARIPRAISTIAPESPGEAGPGILLTSATAVVELMPQSPLVVLLRSNVDGPCTTNQPVIPVARWSLLVSSTRPLLPAANSPSAFAVPPPAQAMVVPRRSAQMLPVEIVENLPPNP